MDLLKKIKKTTDKLEALELEYKTKLIAGQAQEVQQQIDRILSTAFIQVTGKDRIVITKFNSMTVVYKATNPPELSANVHYSRDAIEVCINPTRLHDYGTFINSDQRHSETLANIISKYTVEFPLKFYTALIEEHEKTTCVQYARLNAFYEGNKTHTVAETSEVD